MHPFVFQIFPNSLPFDIPSGKHISSFKKAHVSLKCSLEQIHWTNPTINISYWFVWQKYVTSKSSSIVLIISPKDSIFWDSPFQRRTHITYYNIVDYPITSHSNKTLSKSFIHTPFFKLVTWVTLSMRMIPSWFWLPNAIHPHISLGSFLAFSNPITSQ